MLIERFVKSSSDCNELHDGVMQVIDPKFTEEFQAWLNVAGYSLPEVKEAYLVFTHGFNAENPVKVEVFTDTTTHFCYEMSVKDFTTFLFLFS